MQCVKEFHQFVDEIPLILHGSINQIKKVALLYNAISLVIVKDTTNKIETFLKNVK